MILLWLSFLSCGEPECSSSTPDQCVDGIVPLSEVQLLRRMSIDLRGTLPTVKELNYIRTHPEDLERMRDAWLGTPAVEERMVVLLGEHWKTLVDDITIQTNEVGLQENERYTYVRSVGEEPLRIMARIIRENQSWSEIVNADWTMANSLLSDIWPLEHSTEEGVWKVSQYTDGRPHAGILSTNGLWWRFTTNQSNANRGRAAMLSKQLLCMDYLARPVSFQESTSFNLETETSEAILTDPACQTCHSTLDPIASSLFGYWWFEEHHVTEMSYYHPERELLGERVLSFAPGWFGKPINGLQDLGMYISEDPRFIPCQTEVFAKLLWRREVTEADFTAINSLAQEWQASGLNAHKILKLLTDRKEYRTALKQDDTGWVSQKRMLHSEQLASIVEDLTGFEWSRNGSPLLKDDDDGFRILGGGMDGRMVSKVQQDPSVTWVLLTQRLAEALAQWVVQEDFSSDSPLLLTRVDATTQASDTEFAVQIDGLIWRLFARTATTEERSALIELWQETDAEMGSEQAWTTVLTVLFRDPDFLFY